MRSKDDNNKENRACTDKNYKDILTQADDIILKLISKTEPEKNCDGAKFKVVLASLVCTLFALAVVYIIVKY